MAPVTISLAPDELANLRALADLDGMANGRQPDVADTATALLRRALAASLQEHSPPPRQSPQAGPSPAPTTAEPGSAMSVRPCDRTGTYAASLLAATVIVLLWGGYARGWQWTGFRANGQLWDWMSLLLLPVVVGTLPLWLNHAGEVSRAMRRAGLAAIAAFAVFAAAGYLVPLHWTGFRSQTLWDWFGLLLLPAALVIAPRLPKDIRSLRPAQKRLVVVLVLGWAVTIIGGYALGWKWTGYTSSTLWDWLRLLLLPLVVPTLLMPALLRRISATGTQPTPQTSAATPSAESPPDQAASVENSGAGVRLASSGGKSRT